jgi:hypothetical protein
MFSLYSIYSIIKAFNSLGVANALAFDAKRFSTVNAVDILPKVVKHTIIHGYTFHDALEHALNQGIPLGRHTNVVHIAPHAVIKYVWAHKVYQPWGQESPVQCPQCGILKP